MDDEDFVEEQMIYVSCPFCDEEDFDLVGLKGHLSGDCEAWNEIEVAKRLFR